METIVFSPAHNSPSKKKYSGGHLLRLLQSIFPLCDGSRLLPAGLSVVVASLGYQDVNDALFSLSWDFLESVSQDGERSVDSSE